MGIDHEDSRVTAEEKPLSGTQALDAFMDIVPTFERFRDGVEASQYAPIPADWVIATADIVGSTQAIEEGNYKTVNMIGAGVIAAAMNEIGARHFPFVFGGDGAAFVVPPEWEQKARNALAAMRRWSSDESALSLRAALVPVSAVNEAGQQVRLARFRPSPHASYAMFAGGGLAWAEQQMKAGRFQVATAAEGVRPDLEGLSCRWQPAEASQGEIVSLIVVPGAYAEVEQADGQTGFDALGQQVLEQLQETSDDAGHPLTRRNMRFALTSRGYDLEARSGITSGWVRWKRFKLRWFALMAWSLFKFNVNLGAFDPEIYRNDLRANSDFRKFDDGLKLTVDCPRDTIDRITALLDAAQAAGIAAYGMHRQSSALITCIVPSIVERDHIHFVDGAEGGYARAAEDLKRRRATQEMIA